MGSRSRGKWFFATTLLILGCGDKGTSAPNPCDDDAQLEMELYDDADRVARILYDELIEISDEGTEQKSTVLSADFADLSGFEITTAVTPFGNSCVGMLGLPTSTGDIIPLTVGSITIESRHIGTVPLEKDASDTYYSGYSGNFFSKPGGEEITVQVTSSDTPDTFPSFSETVSAPAALENIDTAVNGDGALTVGWLEGKATYIEIVLRSIADNDDVLENRIRCFFLADDGCFAVPYDAMEWLTSGGTNRIKVRMERHMTKISKQNADTISEIDAMRSIEFNITI